ncbi:MAG: type II secretion system major pseudopilin GspG [Planctomycetota bacterium]
MHIQTHRTSRRTGFSLAELMVVLVIIGLLATVVVRNVLPNIFIAKGTKARADIVTLSEAVEQWAMLNSGTFPDSLEVLVQPDEDGQKLIKGDRIPKDPWGNEYGYEQPTRGNTEPRVFSYGADGQPGGEGNDADIDNFTIRNEE